MKVYCATCGRRPSYRYGKDLDRGAATESCPDPVHEMADKLVDERAGQPAYVAAEPETVSVRRDLFDSLAKAVPDAIEGEHGLREIMKDQHVSPVVSMAIEHLLSKAITVRLAMGELVDVTRVRGKAGP